MTGMTPSFDRREFLAVSVAGAGAAAVASLSLASPVEGAGSPDTGGLIDVNVYLGHWPMRRVRFDEPRELVGKLRKEGVTQAWAGSFDAVLHKDVGGANARLAAECRQFGQNILVPFGTVNPRLPDWEEELRRCAEEHRMPGLRLFPNYHGYTLDDPVFESLAREASRRGLLIQIALLLEDERMMHPLLRVTPVDATPLVTLLPRIPGLRVVLLNALGVLRAKPLLQVIAAGEVSVEIATLEGVGGLGTLLDQIPASRVLFGSYAPLFYFESAVLKLRETAMSASQPGMVRQENAARLASRFP